MAGAKQDRTPPKLPIPVARRLVTLMGRLVFREDVPIEKQRARLERISSAGALPPWVAVAKRSVGGVTCEVVTAADAPAELRLPPPAPRDVAVGDAGVGLGGAAAADGAEVPATVHVVHFHGGGYIVGTPATSRGWAASLAAATGATLVLPDYRLAPEHPFPGALDDAAAVWKELTADVAPGSIVVSGDSAGAGLALALTERLRDEGSELPAGVILVSPWLDLTANRRADRDLARRDPMLTAGWLERASDAYSGGTPLADPGISPLLGSLSGLPPLLVQAGADDVLVPDALRLAREVRAVGGEVTLSLGDRLWHDFPMQAGMLAAADAAVRQAAAFVVRVTG